MPWCIIRKVMHLDIIRKVMHLDIIREGDALVHHQGLEY